MDQNMKLFSGNAACDAEINKPGTEVNHRKTCGWILIIEDANSPFHASDK